MIRTIGDLIAVLSVYDLSLPVVFTSSESGGFWPRERTPLVVSIDDQVFEVDETLVGGNRHLEISLLRPLGPRT